MSARSILFLPLAAIFSAGVSYAVMGLPASDSALGRAVMLYGNSLFSLSIASYFLALDRHASIGGAIGFVVACHLAQYASLMAAFIIGLVLASGSGQNIEPAMLPACMAGGTVGAAGVLVALLICFGHRRLTAASSTAKHDSTWQLPVSPL
jgi:hypothetical protein